MSEHKKPETLRATIAPLPDSDRRNKRRVKIAQPVRVRPSEPGGVPFDEVCATLNVCRNGIYFPTDLDSYYKGMRVFVTFPYSEAPGALNLDYIGEVVRVDKVPDRRHGIAVHLKMSINVKTHDVSYRHISSKLK